MTLGLKRPRAILKEAGSFRSPKGATELRRVPHNNVALFDTCGPLRWGGRAVSLPPERRRELSRERQRRCRERQRNGASVLRIVVWALLHRTRDAFPA